MKKLYIFLVALGILISVQLSAAAPTSTIFTNIFSTTQVTSTNATFLNATSTNFRFGNATGTNLDAQALTKNGVSVLTTSTGLSVNNFITANISQWTNNSNYLTANQTITLSGAITGSGATAITTTFTINGQSLFAGVAPTLGACASGAITASSTNNSGIINASGITLSCVVNFSVNFLSNPACTVSVNSTALTADVQTVSTSSVTFGFSASVGGGQINYHCF